MRSALVLSASVVLAAAIAAPTSTASTIVIGGGLATDCYKAAEWGRGTDTRVCDRALDEPMIGHDRAATYVNRSVLRLRAEDAKGALADCETSIRINSELGEAFVNRGAALMTLGRPKEAIESLSHGIALGVHKLHFAYYDRAMAREDTGDIKGAYEDYKQALAIEPGFTQAAEQLKRFRVVASDAHSS
jgi:tetratricopeptide (TPR) repeat protein